MATPQSPNPIYHDPTQTRRRSSSRRSALSTLSRSASHLDSPRTACPKDGDAFSYDPSHLRSWYVPQPLWDHLPAQLRESLAAVQHAGAAVLTGFARLDKHRDASEGSQAGLKLAADELEVQFDDLPPPKFRTISNASSVFQSDISSPRTSPSSSSQSGSASPIASSYYLSQATCPASPVTLGPPGVTDMRSRSRERSFSTPLQPHDAYYTAELSHLRTEALPRLRHKSIKVKTEFTEAKRTGAVTPADVSAFENWWQEKELIIKSLDARGKRLAVDQGLASTGLGWSAP